MVWFKVDDNLPQHRKVMAIPRRDRIAAIGLWTLAGAWSAHELTDGHVPAHMLEELAGSKRIAEHLVRVGLWEKAEDGWQFHDWSPIQPTRVEVLAKREEEAKRKAEWRARRAAAKAAGRDPDSHRTDDAVPPGQPPDETRDSGVSPEGVTEESRQASDHTRTRTRPVPDPVSPNGDTKNPPGGTRTARPPKPSKDSTTAQRLVAKYVDLHTQRPPQQLVGQVAKAVGGLLAEGAWDPAVIEAGIKQMVRKRLNPSSLPSLVNELANQPAVSDVPPWERFEEPVRASSKPSWEL